MAYVVLAVEAEHAGLDIQPGPGGRVGVGALGTCRRGELRGRTRCRARTVMAARRSMTGRYVRSAAPAGSARRRRGDRLDQLGRLGDVEVQPEHADVDRDDLDAVAAGDQHAVVGVHALDHADGRVDPGQHLLGRGVDGDPGVHAPAGERDLAQHERRVVPAGQRLRGEPPAAGRAQLASSPAGTAPRCRSAGRGRPRTSAAASSPAGTARPGAGCSSPGSRSAARRGRGSRPRPRTAATGRRPGRRRWSRCSPGRRSPRRAAR